MDCCVVSVSRIVSTIRRFYGGDQFSVKLTDWKEMSLASRLKAFGQLINELNYQATIESRQALATIMALVTILLVN